MLISQVVQELIAANILSNDSMKKVSFFCLERIANPLKKKIETKFSEKILRFVSIEDVPKYDGMVKFTVEYALPEALIWLGEEKMFINITE